MAAYGSLYSIWQLMQHMAAQISSNQLNTAYAASEKLDPVYF